jgi:hypothetical protein
MRIVLPPPSTPMGTILDTIRRALIPAISQDEAAARLLLTSPNGTIYSVTVDDAGVLTTAVNDGKTRP